MSLGGFLERKGGARVVMDLPYGGTGMPVGAITQPRLLTPPLATYTLSSTSRSLGLQTNGGQGEMMSRRGSGELDGSDRIREDEYESRSGSDNVEGGSGDDFDPENLPGNKRNRYHRHTPQQIQDLEALFKECPHPDEKQRLELSKRLCLESRQVKFWFQNRRTQMKTQLERHENSILRQENDKLRSENMSIRDAMRNPMCCNCGGPAMLGDVSLEEQHLRIENARLKDELERVCILTGKFLGRPLSTLGGPVPPMPNSSLELAVGGGNGFGGFGSMPTTLPCVSNFATTGATAPMGASSGGGMDRSLERSMYLNLH